jgi:hypothetical protein
MHLLYWPAYGINFVGSHVEENSSINISEIPTGV